METKELQDTMSGTASLCFQDSDLPIFLHRNLSGRLQNLPEPEAGKVNVTVNKRLVLLHFLIRFSYALFSPIFFLK